MPRLVVGKAAPDFTQPDLTGAPVSLGALRGKRTLLTFHRFAACPYCNFRVHQLKTRAPALQAKGLGHIVAFFESAVEPLAKMAERRAVLPFPVVPDPDHRIYDLYGLERSVLGFLKSVPSFTGRVAAAAEQGVSVDGLERDGSLIRMPAEFLLDESGVIRLAHYGRDAADHLPFEAIEAWLAA